MKKKIIYGMYACDTLLDSFHRQDEKSLRHKLSKINIYHKKGLQIGRQKGLVRP